MCKSGAPCGCGASNSGDWIPGPVEVGVGAVSLLWRILRRVVPPLAGLAAVWFSGTPILPVRRRYARRVHVGGRLALSTAAVGLLFVPALTLWALAGIGAATAAGAVGNRMRLAAIERGRHVEVTVGQPRRPTTPRAVEPSGGRRPATPEPRQPLVHPDARPRRVVRP